MSPHICEACVREAREVSLCYNPIQTPSSSSRHTVTGALTVTTFPSSTSSSRALWQSCRTSSSGIGRHCFSCSMALEGPASQPRSPLLRGACARVCGRTYRGRSCWAIIPLQQGKEEGKGQSARRKEPGVAGRDNAAAAEPSCLACCCGQAGRPIGNRPKDEMNGKILSLPLGKVNSTPVQSTKPHGLAKFTFHMRRERKNEVAYRWRPTANLD